MCELSFIYDVIGTQEFVIFLGTQPHMWLCTVSLFAIVYYELLSNLTIFSSKKYFLPIFQQ